MFAVQIQPQAQSSTRPAPSAKLLHRTEPVSPQCRNCKLPGRLQAWIQRAQNKSRLSPPGQVPPGPHKAAICAGRPQGEGVRCPAHPSALGLVHILPTHSESPRPAPAVPARASESRGLDPKQTKFPPRRRAQEGRAYGETRPRRCAREISEGPVGSPQVLARIFQSRTP